MARWEQRYWEGNPSGQTLRDRRPCNYSVYIPDRLGGRWFTLDGDVAAALATAESAIVRLDGTATALTNTEVLARLLLRAECVASSRIEGLEVGGRRLLRADVAQQLGEDLGDAVAVEVLGNIRAMTWGVEYVADGGPLTAASLLAVHRRLLAGTRLEAQGGHIRRAQNWIGGNSYNPCQAEFVPPPHELVGDLLEDLVAFCNDDSLPVLAQAAIAHAQFETIHPFADGNGRTGRVLLHMIMRRRGLGLHILPPVSLILATWSQDYVAGLTGTRHTGCADANEARIGMNRWLAFFASACSRAVDDASRFEELVRDLQTAWQKQAAPARRGSAVRLLIEALPMLPVFTVSTAAKEIGRSFQAANQAIRHLLDAGVLKMATVGKKRNRIFEAPELIEAFTSLERQLASPAGDTALSQPARRVPQQPKEPGRPI